MPERSVQWRRAAEDGRTALRSRPPVGWRPVRPSKASSGAGSVDVRVLRSRRGRVVGSASQCAGEWWPLAARGAGCASGRRGGPGCHSSPQPRRTDSRSAEPGLHRDEHGPGTWGRLSAGASGVPFTETASDVGVGRLVERVDCQGATSSNRKYGKRFSNLPDAAAHRYRNNERNRQLGAAATATGIPRLGSV